MENTCGDFEQAMRDLIESKRRDTDKVLFSSHVGVIGEALKEGVPVNSIWMTLKDHGFRGARGKLYKFLYESGLKKSAERAAHGAR